MCFFHNKFDLITRCQLDQFACLVNGHAKRQLLKNTRKIGCRIIRVASKSVCPTMPIPDIYDVRWWNSSYGIAISYFKVAFYFFDSNCFIIGGLRPVCLAMAKCNFCGLLLCLLFNNHACTHNSLSSAVFFREKNPSLFPSGEYGYFRTFTGIHFQGKYFCQIDS